MTQLILPEHPQVRNELEETYRLWLATHEKVFALFERFALELLAGRRRFGIGMLAERVRWEVHTTWADDIDGFRINNNHRAYIARDLIAKYPDLDALLATRLVKGEEDGDADL